MIDRWLENNVNLDLLSKGIKQFFPEEEFDSKLEQTKKVYKIEAVAKIPAFRLKIFVDIYGKPNDFTIEFTTGKKRKGKLTPSMIMGLVTSPFGGGTFLLRGLKTQEAVDDIEKMFWEHVDKQVAQLTNSADKSS